MADRFAAGRGAPGRGCALRMSWFAAHSREAVDGPPRGAWPLVPGRRPFPPLPGCPRAPRLARAVSDRFTDLPDEALPRLDRAADALRRWSPARPDTADTARMPSRPETADVPGPGVAPGAGSAVRGP